MRKKILGIVVMAVVAVAAAWNINQNENVEALASGEGIDQYGHKLVNNCCKAYQPREYRCSSIWPDC